MDSLVACISLLFHSLLVKINNSRSSWQDRELYVNTENGAREPEGARWDEWCAGIDGHTEYERRRGEPFPDMSMAELWAGIGTHISSSKTL